MLKRSKYRTQKSEEKTVNIDKSDTRIVFRPDFTSKLVHVLAFGTPKFYIAPYDKIKHELVNLSSNCDVKSGLMPDFTSKLVHVLAFGTPKFYIAPYDKIKHELVNLSSNCDVKSGLRPQNRDIRRQNNKPTVISSE